MDRGTGESKDRPAWKRDDRDRRDDRGPGGFNRDERRDDRDKRGDDRSFIRDDRDRRDGPGSFSRGGGSGAPQRPQRPAQESKADA